MHTDEPRDTPGEGPVPVTAPEDQDAPADVSDPVVVREPVEKPDGEDTSNVLPRQVVIEDAERARRAQIIEVVQVSTALEGRQASEPVEALQQEWIADRISLDELRTEVQHIQDAREWSGAKWGGWLIAILLGSIAVAGAMILLFGVEGGSVTVAIRVWGVTAAILNIAATVCRVSAHYGTRNAERSKAISWKDVDGLGKTLSVLSALYVVVGLFVAAG